MRINPNFIKPRYDEGGFAHLPERIRRLFAIQEYKTIIFFFMDGFGWRFYEQFRDHPFFIELSKYGRVEKLTSQFPSTTAAHVTTWHTGMSVGESGVYEWQYYEPKLDTIFAPLLFSYAGTTKRETAQKSGIAPEAVFPTKNIYPAFAEFGVESHIFQHRDYTPTSYSDIIMQGANVHAYKTLSEGLINIFLLLNETNARARYVGLYFGDVDTLIHKYGPNSPQVEAEIESLLDTLLRLCLPPLSQQMLPGKSLLLLTADHGHVEVSPDTCVYLNQDPAFVGIEKFFKRNQAGDLIVPAGSARDMFLYIKDDLLDEACEFIASGLEGIADVVTTQHLIDEGFFGPTISETFLSRVGNLVILPYSYQSVWWYVEGKFQQWHHGHHGGLTPQEMEIPLFTCSF